MQIANKVSFSREFLNCNTIIFNFISDVENSVPIIGYPGRYFINSRTII